MIFLRLILITFLGIIDKDGKKRNYFLTKEEKLFKLYSHFYGNFSFPPISFGNKFTSIREVIGSFIFVGQVAYLLEIPPLRWISGMTGVRISVPCIYNAMPLPI
jgi:hypothetical protein